MRALKFVVDGQILKQDPRCDFSNLVPGSENYLKVEFSFDKEWAGCIKVAGFYSVMGQEYEPQILDENGSCPIPSEATKRKAFTIKVIGQRPDGFKITTNKVTINQNGGKG